MKQLKTLKDFECNKNGFCIICQEKRQEAIKWIKELNNDKQSLDDNIKQRLNFIENKLNLPQGVMYHDDLLPKLITLDYKINAKIDWIKHFFNITDSQILKYGRKL